LDAVKIKKEQKSVVELVSEENYLDKFYQARDGQ
jgi:hypothetical protein